MKKTQLLVVVLLVVVTAFGWLAAFKDATTGTNREKKEAIKMAEEYMDRELYQKAIQEYDKAIAIEDSENLRIAVLKAYELRLQESANIEENYLIAAESANAAYPKNEDFYLKLAKLYMLDDNYKSAYKCLLRAGENKVKSKKIDKLLLEVKFSYEMSSNSYTTFSYCTNGTFAVKSEEKWGMINETGGREVSMSNYYVSPKGEQGIYVVSADTPIGKLNMLMDADDIVVGKLKFEPTAAGCYSEGLIAIKGDKNFGYYNSLGEYKFGDYLAAGRFQGNKAAVKTADNQWKLIDETGNDASSNRFEDVKLGFDGSYLINDVMIAKQGGKYTFFNKKGDKTGKESWDDVGLHIAGQMIAVKQGDKWGFMDENGKMKIKPQYENAKSFSRGLAAVCIKGKWGFINTKNELVIPTKFFDADYFTSKGTCLVKKNGANWDLLTLNLGL